MLARGFTPPPGTNRTPHHSLSVDNLPGITQTESLWPFDGRARKIPGRSACRAMETQVVQTFRPHCVRDRNFLACGD